MFLDQEPYYLVPDIDFQLFVSEFARIGIADVDGKKMSLTKDGKNFLFSENIIIDEVLGPIHQQVIDVVNSVKKDSKRDVLEFIKNLSDFNSNPESINYLGETLLSVKVFLTNKKEDWGAESVNEAQEVIEEVLDKAFNDDRLKAGIFDPVFDLTKISWLIDYLKQKIEENEMSARG